MSNIGCHIVLLIGKVLFKSSEAVKTLKKAFGSGYETAMSAFKAIKNGTAIKTLKKSFASGYESAMNAFKAIKNGTAIKTLKKSFASGYESAMNAFKAIKNGTATKTLKAAGKSAIDKAKKSWDSVKSKAVNLKLKLNGAVDNIKGTVNSIIDSINKNVIAKIKLTVPKSWPVIGGKSIGPPPNIPHFAKGGFPEEGPFFMNRGEIAGKFGNGKTVVANNEQIEGGIARGIAPAVYDAVSAAIRNNQSSGNGNGGGQAPYVEVTIMCDAETLFRTVQKGRREFKNRYNVCVDF